MADDFTIRVSNIDVSRGGNIGVYIFGRDGFPTKHEKALHSKTLKADKNELNFTFNTDLRELAIKIHHDEDGNGKITKNWTGIIPAEGLGFSNDQKISFLGPPSYKKSKIYPDEFQKGIAIEIIYP